MNEGSMAQISSTLLMAKPYADMCPSKNLAHLAVWRSPGRFLQECGSMWQHMDGEDIDPKTLTA